MRRDASTDGEAPLAARPANAPIQIFNFSLLCLLNACMGWLKY
jgi:hypothetical protein